MNIDFVNRQILLLLAPSNHKLVQRKDMRKNVKQTHITNCSKIMFWLLWNIEDAARSHVYNTFSLYDPFNIN